MVWIKFGKILSEIPDTVWKNYLSNSYIKGADEPTQDKIKEVLGLKWYLDNEVKKKKN